MSDNKEYKNKDIKVIWEKSLCIHSANCVRNLPGVFKPHERPWITLGNADTEHIIEAVNKCPSGALTWKKLVEDKTVTEAADLVEIEVFENGPVIVKGNCAIKNSKGEITSKTKQVALCRCGHSENKPFCDGNHKKKGFVAE